MWAKLAKICTTAWGVIKGLGKFALVIGAVLFVVLLVVVFRAFQSFTKDGTKPATTAAVEITISPATLEHNHEGEIRFVVYGDSVVGDLEITIGEKKLENLVLIVYGLLKVPAEKDRLAPGTYDVVVKYKGKVVAQKQKALTVREDPYQLRP